MQRHVSSQQQSLDWSDIDWFDLVTIDLTKSRRHEHLTKGNALATAYDWRSIRLALDPKGVTVTCRIGVRFLVHTRFQRTVLSAGLGQQFTWAHGTPSCCCRCCGWWQFFRRFPLPSTVRIRGVGLGKDREHLFPCLSDFLCHHVRSVASPPKRSEYLITLLVFQNSNPRSEQERLT
jgi:hypothetical protein